MSYAPRVRVQCMHCGRSVVRPRKFALKRSCGSCGQSVRVIDPNSGLALDRLPDDPHYSRSDWLQATDGAGVLRDYEKWLRRQYRRTEGTCVTCGNTRNWGPHQHTAEECTEGEVCANPSEHHPFTGVSERRKRRVASEPEAAPARVLHANCGYVGRCIEHDLDPTVRRCDP